MTEADVVIVGARWAGSALATQLAEAGRRVVVLERASRFTAVASTHIFHLDGARAAFRLGVLGDGDRHGAPYLVGTKVNIEGLAFTAPFHLRPGDPPGGVCIRRHLLDPLVARRAEDAGAEIRMSSAVEAVLCSEDGVVHGVRARAEDGSQFEVRAPLVVGADGRGSTIARLVGARTSNVVVGERFITWGYLEGSPAAGTDHAHLMRDKVDFHLAIPTDSGLVMIVSDPPLGELETARRDRTGYLHSKIDACTSLRAVAGDGRFVARPNIVGRTDSFFRQPIGPGWALIGDSSRFVDPASGRGMSDALHHARALGDALAGVDVHDPRRLAAALRTYRRGHNRLERPWSALLEIQCRAAPMSHLEQAALRALSRMPDGPAALSELTSRRRTPARLLPTRAIPGVAIDAVRAAGFRQTVLDATQLIATELRHRTRLWRFDRPSASDGAAGDTAFKPGPDWPDNRF